MIKFSAQNALVHSVSPVTEIPSKTGGQPFYKRELIINDSWSKDGQQYASFVCIEFTGDRMGLLDPILPGTHVNVEGFISGREYNGRVFNTIRGQSVSPSQPQQYGVASAPTPTFAGYPQPNAGYPGQQSGYGQQPGYPQPPGAYQQQASPQPYATPAPQGPGTPPF
ncbi:MAG: DUF3127 domain-containing protein [Bacteroidales bacterium]|nr:DUF3127 domain-containing protein [Bacteroidales bacterium]